MRKALNQSTWVLVVASLVFCSPMSIGAGDKDKQRENDKGQEKAKDGEHDNDRHKVTICHRGHTISVSKSALQAHLNHGDTVGPCDVTPHKNK